MAHVCDLRAIAERAEQQLGLVTVDQLRSLGVSRQMERTLLARGGLEPLGVRVRGLPGKPVSWHQRLLAAVLEAGQGAVVSHVAAAAVWGFAGVSPGAVEITVPHPRRPRRVVGRVHTARDLLPVDIGHRGLLPVTTPSRTLIDAAPWLTRRQLEETLDHAARDGLIWPPHLRWRVEELRRHGRRGVTRILDLLPAHERRRDEESWLERRAVDLLVAAGLPRPRCQARLRHSGGTARVDLIYDEARLVIELAGHATHSTRRQRQADAEREARLVAEGLRVITFTYEDVVERPSYVVETVGRLLSLSG